MFGHVLILLLALRCLLKKNSQITYRELKRLDSVNRSPIYALLGETVDGVAVIRAFGAEQNLLKRLTKMLNTQQHAYFLTCAAQSWLAVRLELIGTLIITFSCEFSMRKRSFLHLRCRHMAHVFICLFRLECDV